MCPRRNKFFVPLRERFFDSPPSLANVSLAYRGGRGIFESKILSPGGRRILPGGLFSSQRQRNAAPSEATLWRSDLPRFLQATRHRYAGPANDGCFSGRLRIRQWRRSLWAASRLTGCGDAASISVGCCSGCLTRLVPRCGPRETYTIGVRPVLPPARKWQWFRDRCHNRSAAQSNNVRRQRENARTAYYQDGKREEHFLRQSHLLTHCLNCLSA